MSNKEYNRKKAIKLSAKIALLEENIKYNEKKLNKILDKIIEDNKNVSINFPNGDVRVILNLHKDKDNSILRGKEDNVETFITYKDLRTWILKCDVWFY